MTIKGALDKGSKNLPHVHGDSKNILVFSDHVGSTAVGLKLLVHALVLFCCASRLFTIVGQRLLKLDSVVVIGMCDGREPQSGVDSALCERIRGLTQAGEVGRAASREYGLSSGGEGASAKGDECNSAREFHD